MKEIQLRAIPSVNELLETPEAGVLIARTSRDYVRDVLRGVLDGLRAELLAQNVALPADDLRAKALSRLERIAGAPRSTLRRVVNATGVVLHTNLGRAPLSRRALDAVVAVASGYSNLEYDLDAGGRGRRDAHGEALLCDVLGCEAAVVANNNAAAVMLALNTLAAGGDVIVSRGELVEIGGGFRIPEVLERSGCTLREVGTTNRTRAADYENAVTDRTRALLRVHPSNFRIVGFTERPSARELAEVARRHQIPLIDDLGSGCVIDVTRIGLGDEPRCQDALADGVDLIAFSGDKLLGGPQAGIVAGRRDLVDRIRRNPLMRALRVDKMVYAALDATLQAYVEGRAVDEIPSLRMLAASDRTMQARAESLAERIERANGALRVALVAGRSVPGAGSAPGVDLPTTLVTLAHPEYSAAEIDARFRRGDPPIVARIERDMLVVDLRAVDAADESIIVDACAQIR